MHVPPCISISFLFVAAKYSLVGTICCHQLMGTWALSASLTVVSNPVLSSYVQVFV